MSGFDCSIDLRCHVELVVRPISDTRRHWTKYRLRKLHTLRMQRFDWVHRAISKGVSHPRFGVRRAASLPLIFAGRLQQRDLELSNESHHRESDLEGGLDKLSRHVFSVELTISVAGSNLALEQASNQINRIAAAINQFVVPRRSEFKLGRIKAGRTRPSSWLLSSEELATIWHLPTAGVSTADLRQAHWRVLVQFVCACDLLAKCMFDSED